MNYAIKFLLLTAIVLTLAKQSPAELRDMHDGTIYDTDKQLSWLKDAGTGGEKTWDEAVAWSRSLNDSNGFAGLTGWRLPKADPACPGDDIPYGLLNCTKSEMGHLYYTELRNVANGTLTNTSPFTHLQAVPYWSGTEYSSREYGSEPGNSWCFTFDKGAQFGHNNRRHAHAWAVRPGART